MIIEDFYLDRVDWNVKVYFYVDELYEDLIIKDLKGLGCEAIEETMASLFARKYNNGLTYTSPEHRASLVVIGQTDSPEEFQSTLDHEKGHLAVHIADSLGISLRGEEFQYIIGDIGREMYPVALLFLCPHCGQEISLYKGKELMF